jgi:unsaturated rhamnogalacturonyl hydrolase
MKTRHCFCAVLLSLLLVGVSGSESLAVESKLPAGVSRVAIGVRLDDRMVSALVTSGFLDSASQQNRVLLVVDENRDGVEFAGKVEASWRRIETDAGRQTEIALVRIEKGTKAAVFPPEGTSYQGPDPAAQYLWRWIGMAAPDLVVEVRAGDSQRWSSGNADAIKELATKIGIETRTKDGSLTAALAVGTPCDVGAVPGVLLETSSTDAGLKQLFDFAAKHSLPLSAARKELQRRSNRSPVEIATELSRVYGHQLGSVAYIPSLALIGRLRLGELTHDVTHQQDVLKIVAPYADGKKSTLGNRPSGSTMPGHLVFGELADRTKNLRFVELACVAGNLGFNEDGSLKPSMPFHSEMSDAVFMGTPILVQCGRLTGETKYFDMAARHLRFMLKLNLRDDGLHQHSPIDPEHTAWGRGNGFPGLGLALCLSDLPEDSQYRDEFLSAYRAHMAAMIRHQDATGMWHQIVDHPESYREFTVTCMTTFAITRGLRRGWLDRETYEPVVRRAWEAIKLRIGPDGKLVDVCTGTGKQKSRREYYHRAAILGRDDRGGAMALMVSTELAFAQRENAVNLEASK